MNPGDLRERITIQEKAQPVARDASGAERPIWSDVATVWAAIEPLRGQEYLEANRLDADIEIRIRIRFRRGLVPSMRVLTADNRILNIVSVIHVRERKREIQLMCKQIISKV